MNLRWKIQKKNYATLLFFVLMAIGIAARVIGFGVVPGDLNQDEAYAGYEAYSLLIYGMDSAGYRFPVYLYTWGSGMSALNTYLMMPFIALFGPKIWVIRLPQLIIACLTLWVVYLLARRMFDERIALFTLFLLAICPWHITMSRWGLDANLAPGFLIFALYFYIRGLENSKYLMLSSLMYGLSLYCYATIWAIVPVLIAAEFLYGLYVKKLRLDRYVVLSVLILGATALPLILFLLVNMGVLEEIRLPFLSIPRLLYMRSDDMELNLAVLVERAKNVWRLMKVQSDNIVADGTEEYGIYYSGTLSFFMLGVYYCLRTWLKKVRRREYAPEFLLLLQTAAGIGLGMLLTRTTIYRNNILFIPMVMIAARGVCYLFELINIRELILPVLYYLVMFAGFMHYYFTDYADLAAYPFCRGLEAAVEEAASYEGPIYYSRGIEHSRILFLTREPVQNFIDTVEYYYYPARYLEAKSFSRYSCEFDAENPDVNATYLLGRNVDWDFYEEQGFTVHRYDWFAVAHHPDNVHQGGE
ncbi:MAG: glycosyltransferase family 39 protein [Roseburia sp.]|nr:glycosyltransferase family 39 protein [Roseburia sp.]